MVEQAFPKYEALNDFEKLVVSEYLTGEHRFNKHWSYRSVKEGPDGQDVEGGGAKEPTGNGDAWQWRARASAFFGRDKIREAIEEMLGAGCGLDPVWVKRRLGEIASGGDIADFEPYIEGDRSLDDLREAGHDTRAVRSVKVTKSEKGETRYIEMVDPMPALTQAVRVLGMGIDKMEVDLTATGLEGQTDEELRAMEQAIYGRMTGKADGTGGEPDSGGGEAKVP